MSISFPTIILFCAGIIMAHFCIGLLYKEIEYLKLYTVSGSVYFSVFVIVSGCFFWMDRFSMTTVLSVVLAFFAVGVVLAVIRRKSWKITLTFKEDRARWLYWIILIGFLVSAQKFSFFGMGQDQGVYQTKAIALAAGTTKQQLTFDEYDNLQTQEQLTEATEKTRALLGYDFYDSRKPTLSEENREGTVSGIFHGIPTFPALLALFELMLGMSNMQAVQSVFFLCTAFFVLLIVESLSLKKGAQLLAISIVSLCPIIQWVMKSALTEGYLCLLFAGIMYGILSKNTNEKWLSVLFAWGFSFYHVTIYTMIPLFLALFLVMFLETENRQFLLMGSITMLGFSTGYTMMLFVSPTYSYNNTVLKITILQKWGEDKIVPAVWCLTALVFVLYFVASKIKLQAVYKKMLGAKGFEWFIRAVMILSFLLIIRRGIDVYLGKVDKLSGGLYSLRMMTILVFAYGSGIASFILLLGKAFFRPRDLLVNSETILISIAFGYGVLLISALIRQELLYCYYYSRYLAPFFVIIAITTGVILNTISNRLLYGLSVCGMVILLPFDWILATKLDDSRMEWDVLGEVLALCDDANSAVIVEDSVKYYFVMPIKTATNCDVYPALSDLDEQLDAMSEHYENVIVVTDLSGNRSRFSENWFSMQYCNVNYSSQDDGHYIGKLIPFPYDFYENENIIAVLKYEKPRYFYSFADNDFPIYGFDSVENNRYRWIKSTEAGFTARIMDNNYQMNVVLGPGIPLAQLGLSEYPVEVYANSHHCGTIKVTSSKKKEYSVLLPEEYIVDGPNEISFVAETWSPSQYGEGDHRQLTLSISSISFEQPNDEPVYLDFGEVEDFSFAGFSSREEHFRWTNSEVAAIATDSLWTNKDYTCDVVLGASIPNGCFVDGKYEVTVYINDESSGIFTIMLYPGQREFSFDIDARNTCSGENVIYISSQLWSPSDYGASDTRELGISIDKLILTVR